LFLTGLPSELAEKKGVRVQVLGKIDLLPADVQEAAYNVMDMTKHQVR
jgi:undecaprenyl pyrophosphate synthase